MYHYDLGTFTWPVTTHDAEAQAWFNRGAVWCHGFNHEQAIECFERAISIDPDCAMAHWGIAYAVGPNYNKPWSLFDPTDKARSLARAHAMLAKAEARASAASEREQALIGALRARYPQASPVDDLAAWDDAYAAAMRGVLNRFPEDLQIVTLYVEAAMNRAPWKLWDLKNGAPTDDSGAAELSALCEATFARDARAWGHPGLLHLYIHLMELSPNPERALLVGERLRELAPDAGHLVHMPTHIDLLCGRYQDSVYWNEKAAAADDKYVAHEGALNFYTFYRVHNLHFIAYGAMFLGRLQTALRATERLQDAVPEALLRIESPPMADYLEAYVPMKQHVLIRFGRWRDILLQPLPQDRELYAMTTAMMRYAKGVACAATGDVATALNEREAFALARERVPQTRRVHNNLCSDLLAVGGAMLDGEIEYRRGNWDRAFAHLRRAVELDDDLPYDEPWGWMQPTRHALGALLLEQNRVDEAEAVYRADLGLDPKVPRSSHHPDNVWSLHGLHECLVRRGAHAEAAHVWPRLKVATALADVPVTASCLCRGNIQR